MRTKKVGLALGGGGAKGLAHIGVIQALEDAGISIDYITGTSMGALVGGWYAATKDIISLKEMFLGLKKRDLFPISRVLRKQDGAIFRDNSLVKLLESELKDKKIEECAIPFRAVATDVSNGDEVLIERGGITEAIRASAALPIIFNPVEVGTKILMDGGFSNPVPADVVRSMGAEYVIAVDVSSRWLNFSDRSLFISNIYSLMENALTLIEYQLAKVSLKEADILLRPSVMRFSWLEFDEAWEIIQQGAKETRKHLKEIRKATGYSEPPKTAMRKFWEFLLDVD